MDQRLLKIKTDCEAGLDELAAMRSASTGEDYLTAYAETCNTDLGKRLVKSLDDVTALMTKGATSDELERLANEEKLRRKKKQPEISDKELARRMKELAKSTR